MSYEVAAITILSISSLCFLGLWIREKTSKAYIKNFKSIDRKFFFFHDPHLNQSYISKSLKTILHLGNRQNQFECLVDVIVENDQLQLNNLYQKLVQNRDEPSINTTLNITLKALSTTKIKRFGCDVVQNSDTGGFFIFFTDTSQEAMKSAHINYENEVLKRDLAYKNNILNAIDHPIWARDKDLNINYFNSKFIQIVSLGTEQIMHGVPEIVKDQKERAKTAIANKETIVEEKFLVINGQRYLYKLHEGPIPGLENTVGFAYDVTSKNELKIELERHISAQANLLEATSSSVAIYGSDMRLKFFNRAFMKLWDLEEAFLLKQPTYGQILDLLQEQQKIPAQLDYAYFKKSQLDLFTDLFSTQNDFLYLPSGKYIRVIVIQHPLGGLLFSYEDMTDWMRLEMSYKTLSAVQKETIDNLNDGITVFAEDGNLQISNSKFAQLWNISPEDLSNTLQHSNCHIQEMLNILEPRLKASSRSAFKNIVVSSINSRKTKSIQVELIDDGVMDVLFVPLPDSATLICYKDITDSVLVEQTLRERNKALQEADRLKTEFLANISYELRSPLTSILGFSEVLLQKYFGDLTDKQLEYVQDIASSSEYLMSVINDILDLASIDAGYMQLNVTKFDIFKSIAPVCELVQERMKERNLKFAFTCPAKIGHMIADVQRIKQVLFKLLSNAIDYSKENGSIILEISKDAENVTFDIKDDGYGMDEEVQRHIFDKFFRKTIKTIKAKKTVGLGLSLVRSFVELHNGTITVESKQGAGTVLKLQIPLNNPELAAQYKDALREKKQNLRLIEAT